MIYLKTGIGIEPRGNDLLIASLEGNFSGGTFTHFARIADYATRPADEVRREIQRFFREKGIGRDNIVLGIPRREVLLREIDLPAEVRDDLRQVLSYQVQSYAPTDEESYYFDHLPLDDGARAGKITVMLVMVRKSVVDGYLRLLAGFELHPAVVIPASMGLANLFLAGTKGADHKTCLLADCGTRSLEILALRGGKLVHSREAPGGDGRSRGDLLVDEVSEALSRMRLGPGDTIDRIVLTGESSAALREEIRARIPDSELLEESLRIAAPLETRGHLREAAATLGLAHTGSAGSPALRVNLLPPEIRLRRMRWAHIPAAVLGGVILLLLAALALRPMVQNRVLASALDREIEALREPVGRVQALQREAEELERKAGAMEALLSSRNRNLEILQQLTLGLPSDTFLTSYSNRDGTIQLVGLSGSSSELIPLLERSPLLRDVAQKGTIYRDTQTGRDRFTFEAKLENAP
jgi:Tfp pilus assembly protein PilN